MASNPGERHAFPQLDGLRALAISTVILTHYSIILGLEPAAHFSVRLFFVLSGFLITRIILADKLDAPPPGHWWLFAKHFYGRRALRLLPILYLTILAGVLLGVDKLADSWAWHVAYLSNFWRATAPLPQFPAGHYWTLAVEEQFYFLWPPLLMLTPRRHLARLCVALLIVGPLFRVGAVLLGWRELGVGVMLPSCVDSLAAGGLFAVLRETRPGLELRWWRYCPPVVLALSFALVFAVAALRPAAPALVFGALDTVCAALALMLVVRAVAGETGLAGRLLEWGPVQWIGKTSYGIYVIHQLVMFLVLQRLPLWTGPLPYFASVLIAGGATLTLASLSFVLIERPINDLKRYLPMPVKRLRAAAMVPATAA